VVGLAASLALAAAGFAFASRERRGWARLPFPLIASLLPVAVAAFLLIWTWDLRSRGGPDWFPHVAAWAAAYAGGFALLFRRSWRRAEQRPTRSAIAAGFLCLAASAALWLAFLGTIAWLDAAAAAEFRRLAAASAAEVQALGPEVPAAENAAAIYDQAFTRLGSGRLQVNAPEPLPGEAARRVDAFIEERAAALELLERAAGLPHCRTQGADDATLTSWRYAASDLLALHARREAGRGRIPEALQALERQASLALHAAGDGQPLTACGLLALARRAAEHVLAAGSRALAEVPRPIPEPICGPPLATALRRARARDLAAAAAIAAEARAFNGAFSGEHFVHAGSLGTFLHETRRKLFRAAVALPEFREIARRSERLERLAAGPPVERFQVSREWARQLASRPGWFLGPVLTPWLDGLEAVARAEANVACTALALAAAAHQAARGAYPVDGSALVPEFIARVPMDPFSGEPLRLLPQEGGLIIYSVGPNGVDDGGAELDLVRKSGDLTFVLGSAYAARRQAQGEAVHEWSAE
jgi:hypothetical protein